MTATHTRPATGFAVVELLRDAAGSDLDTAGLVALLMVAG